ncbi:MAG: phenylalanine--tRNA ligase subunit alpha [Candidatus Marinimicrobia bacterium]|nr:phenylalanine--tRNA ligase subunit alpha [Candidatus Neomarinimicrobiota bacterium]
MSNLFSKIKQIEKSFKLDRERALKDKDFGYLKNAYIGRKGRISLLFKELSQVSPENRKKAGEKINSLKNNIYDDIQNLIGSQSISSSQSELSQDFSLPGSPFSKGRLHPLTIVTNEIKEIFNKIGFDTVFGPEIDTDFYNFEALNIPKNHPARDMQDTFYINSELLLRTHTSSTQVHFMENNSPPIRIISPGRVYRNEDISVKSYCLFHQVEGLYVDKNVSFSDLKATLDYFAKTMFGKDVRVRFRPSFFPFTEPSAEMDIYWGLETQADHRVTKGTGWLEILGCGMVDPNVFKSVNYDSSKWRGFAFGMGIERIAMLKYGVNDIRKFYDGNIKFLEQFKI